jgi:hypothetical protein
VIRESITTMEVRCQAILPSGRAIQYRKLTTGLNNRIQLSVATKVGKQSNDEVRKAVFTSLYTLEVIAACLTGITAPLEWKYKPAPPRPAEEDAAEGLQIADVDVDAMLASVPASGWRELSRAQLAQKDADTYVETLLDDPLDFAQATKLMLPSDPRASAILGKYQLISGG